MDGFKAKVRREYSPEAQRLIDAYEGAVGSTGPGANPGSIAAVLSKLLKDYTTCHKSSPAPFVPAGVIINLIKELR